MAGGKMSARQKMINLMYLVFIAMLAMNMSKEVLSAFGYNKQDLDSNIITLNEKNLSNYNGLTSLANEQPLKYGKLKLKADSVKALSNKFYLQLEALKDSMLIDIPAEDRLDYESMDKTDWTNRFFKTEPDGSDGYSEYGQEFFDDIVNYKKGMSAILGTEFPALEKTILNRFPTEDKKNSKGRLVKFLKYYYEGFPMVATLNNFTSLQAKIKTSENDVTIEFVGGKMKESGELNNFKAIVALDKSSYFEGEKVTGKVILGRYDSTFLPKKVMLGNVDITNDMINGQVMLNTSSGTRGTREIKGEIFFVQDGEEVKIPYDTKYEVERRPDAFFLSADKMNVVYRGLPNPVSVSIPGIAEKNLRVSFGRTKFNKTGAGKYDLFPSSKDKTVLVNVSASIDGVNKKYPQKLFEVKDLPAAQGKTRGLYKNIRITRSDLANLKIGAGLPGFIFTGLRLTVTEFSVKVPGSPAIIGIKGRSFNESAKRALRKARIGDFVTIYNIKAKVKGSIEYKLPKGVNDFNIKVQ